MGSDDDGVRAAARAIRPYLDEPSRPAMPVYLDRQIADQLNSTASRPETAVALRALLEG